MKGSVITMLAIRPGFSIAPATVLLPEGSAVPAVNRMMKAQVAAAVIAAAAAAAAAAVAVAVVVVVVVVVRARSRREVSASRKPHQGRGEQGRKPER